MSQTDIDEVKLGGARRKNGHKSNCTCHICENMKKKARRGGYTEEIEKKNEYISGGLKKKNGHRKDCKCPICKNMKNAKKGGNDNEEEEPMRQIDFEKREQHESMAFQGGKRKKSNGHKLNCMCPICKNMRKSKKGGDEPDEENQLGDIEEGGIKAVADNSDETKASDEEYDELDSAERGESPFTNPNMSAPAAGGATRKHKKKGGKKWGGKTRRARRTRRRQRSRRHH